MTWGDNRWLVIDSESTGTNVHTDRIVTAGAAIMHGEQVLHRRSWLIAVEVDIPAEAEAVHGISTAHARANGIPTEQGIKEIAGALQFAHRAGLPTVIYNSPFDMSLLDAECRRVGLGPLADLCGVDRLGPVIDPLCIDRSVDRYRPGGRKLTQTCALFGVDLGDNAHNADADMLAAGQLAHRMWLRSRLPAADLLRVYADRRYPQNLARDWRALGRMSLAELHDAQVGWYAEQSESLGLYWAGEIEAKRAVVGSDEADDDAREIARQEIAELEAGIASLSTEWPMRRYAGATQAVAA